MSSVDAFGHFTFKVGLEALDLSAQFLAQSRHLGVDFIQRDGAVLGRVALAEHVQVDAVQDKDVHGGSLSLDGSWALDAGPAIVGDLRQYHARMTVAGLLANSTVTTCQRLSSAPRALKHDLKAVHDLFEN
jgi:hypothetical protein